jgi:hypothetical protein
MADTEGPPVFTRVPLNRRLDHGGQHCVAVLKILLTELPALALTLAFRCLLAVSCVKAINLSMLAEGCDWYRGERDVECERAFMVTWWIAVFFCHAMMSIIFRIIWMGMALCFRASVSSNGHATLKKCDAALILLGLVWHGLGLLCAFTLSTEEAGPLRNMIAICAMLTLVVYPGEAYIFYWRLFPLREDLNRFVNLFQREARHGLPKRLGSLTRCALVAPDDLVDIENARARECAICLDEITAEGTARKTPCGHFFHESCLEGWFLQAGCCPLCREDCSTSVAAPKDTLAADVTL